MNRYMLKEIGFQTLIFGTILGMCVLVIWAAIHNSERCQTRGGHLTTHYGWGYGFDGKFVQTSQTLCLSSDGRILE